MYKSFTASKVIVSDTNGQMSESTVTSAQLDVSSIGGFLAIRTTSIATTLTATDVTIECLVGGYTVTLPTAVGIAGRIYCIKKNVTGPGTAITINTTLGQTIDGALTQTISNGSRANLMVQSNGTDWIIL